MSDANAVGRHLWISFRPSLSNGDGLFARIDNVMLSVIDQTNRLDGDAMADAWELRHFGNVQLSDGTQDQDGDGFIDVFEYLSGTVPTNDASLLRIVRATPASTSAYELAWPGVTGKTYRIVYRTNLYEGVWMSGSTNVPGVDPLNVHTSALPGHGAYFRVELER